MKRVKSALLFFFFKWYKYELINKTQVIKKYQKMFHLNGIGEKHEEIRNKYGKDPFLFFV